MPGVPAPHVGDSRDAHHMSDKEREMRMAYSILTTGNARTCLTEHELSMAEADVNLAKEFNAEWNPNIDITLAHPKVGFCAAAATIINFADDKIGKDNMHKIISFMNWQASRLCKDEQYLKSLSNELMNTPRFAKLFMPIIDFVNNLRRQIDRDIGSAEDAARITLAIFCPQLFDFGCYESVKVEKSSIHGNGLFASRRILFGEIITIYPSSIIRFGKAENEHVFTMGTYTKMLDKYAFNIRTLLRCYEQPMQILPNAERCEQPRAGQMGHLVNAANTDTGLLSIFDERINCIPVPILAGTCIAMIAKRHIDEGSEILTHYAMNYDWSS